MQKSGQTLLGTTAREPVAGLIAMAPLRFNSCKSYQTRDGAGLRFGPETARRHHLPCPHDL